MADTARDCPHSGAALLTVVAATATMSVLLAMLLAETFVAYEAGAYDADGAQARALCGATLLEIERLIGDDARLVPTAAAVELLNGNGAGAAGVLTSASPPALDAALRHFQIPPLTSTPSTTILGRGVAVRISLVVGPGGAARQLEPIAGVAGLLVDAQARAWFRRGAADCLGRYAVWPGELVHRLE